MVKKKVIPKLKKKINSFLSEEDGQITKSSVLKTGAVVGMLALIPALADIVSAASTNTLADSYDGSTVTGTHTNHANHASHGSHGSHSSW